MEELIIEGTEYSPQVILSPTRKEYSIAGWSRPESPSKFYTPIFNWIETNGPVFFNNATINFRIEYFNTPSAKMIRFLFDRLDKLYKSGTKFKVIWQYDEIESKEEFEYEFGQGLSFPIEYILVEE